MRIDQPSGRDDAIRLALKHIDQHRKEYDKPEAQHSSLRKLVLEHDISESKKAWSSRVKKTVARVKVLQSYRYREILLGIARNKKWVKQSGSATRVFSEGSDLFTAEYLQKIGFESQATPLGEEEDISEHTDSGSIATSVVVAAVNIAAPAQKGQTSGKGSAKRTFSDTENEHTTSGIESASRPVASTALGPVASRADISSDGNQEHMPQAEPLSGPDSTAIKAGPSRANQAAPTRQIGSEDQSVRTSQPKKRKFDHNRRDQETDPQGNPDAATDLLASLVPANPIWGPLMLGPNPVVGGLDNIWIHTQSTASTIYKAILTDAQGRVNFNPQPSAALRALYTRLFSAEGGTDWETRAHLLERASKLHCQDILAACIAAAVFNLVFERELPWQKTEATTSLPSRTERIVDYILRICGSPMRSKSLIERAMQLEIDDEEFRNVVVQPAARAVTAEFLFALDDQLRTMGGKITSEATVKQHDAAICKLFLKALILRSNMQVARGNYRWTWIHSTAILDEETMEDVSTCTGNDHEVMWCVSPLVEIEDVAKPGEWEVVYPAKVFSRPKE